MPEPVASTSSSTSPSSVTVAADVVSTAAAFADQLRAASSGRSVTVSLGTMVTAHATGLAALTATGAAATATSASVGLGAMGALANGVTANGMTANGVAASGNVGIVRAKSGDDAKIDTVVRFAMAQQGKPYVFGTRGPDTYDCSGLMTAAYKEVGIEMPAYTFTQARLGREVDPSTEPIKPGDMIFVRGGRPPTDLGHVGMAISATEWIQAPRTGDVVKTGPLPYDRIQVVRRMIG